MAVNRAIKIEFDSTISDAKYQEVLARVLADTQSAGTTTTTTGTYAAGTGFTANVAVAIA